jgi:Ras-related protein Rab-1A
MLYSQFDEKVGPTVVACIPPDLPTDLKILVSLKSIDILSGEKGLVPKSLAIIPFASLDLKGLVKLMETRNLSRRGGLVDSAITLLFTEANDPIFYKYMDNFKLIFDEAAAKFTELEEAKAGTAQINEALENMYANILQTLNELHDLEIGTEKPDVTPEAEAEETETQGYRFKIIVCGDPAVGKTSTILRFTDRAFKKVYVPTIGTNIVEKYIRIKNARIEFVIWDIAGQSKFKKIRKHFYTGADGELIIFDLTHPNTFNDITDWYQDITSNLNRKLPGFIIGNKSDLVDQRAVSSEEIKQLANELGLEYVEISALSGENVDEAFHKLAELLITDNL